VTPVNKPFDLERVRAEFPLLDQEVNGHPLVYLDNAATTQKPRAVIQALEHYYQKDNSNVHRGAHAVADRATRAFEAARASVAKFINAARVEEVIWTRGTTESINLVAQTYGQTVLQEGDVILVPVSEHHANIVPWQMVAQSRGASVIPIPLTETCDIDLVAFDALLEQHSVKIVAVNQVSNALGTINPVADIIAMAKVAGAAVLIDGAQGVAHSSVDVQALGADFYVFSGHKLYGPTGIGVLWGKKELLDAMPPYQGGGEMIETVSFDGTTYNQVPFKFEAGTPNIAGAIGLAAAIEYLESIGIESAVAHEESLMQYLLESVSGLNQVQRVGDPARFVGIFSFLVPGTHPSDIGMLLDQQGVAIRTGHHCTQPLMQYLNAPGTARASLSFYNNKNDVDAFVQALDKACRLLV
jgi:cysteine desulfurase/selenocysteine lyase